MFSSYDFFNLSSIKTKFEKMKKKKVRIRVSKNSLYLDYFFNGQRKREFIQLSNTPQNYEIAQKIATEKEAYLNNIQNTLNEWNLPKEKLDSDIVQIRLTHELVKKKMRFNLSDGLKQFLNDNPKNKKNKDVYNAAVKVFNEVIVDELNIKEITKEHYQKIKDHLLTKKSYSTARTYLNYLRMLFDYFIRINKYSNNNPFLKLKDRPKQNIRTVFDKHWEIILPYLNKNNLQVYNFILFLKLTGFRRDEAIKLKWSDIRFDDGLIVVTTYKDNQREDLFPLDIHNGDLRKHLLDMLKRKTTESNNLFSLSSEYPRKYFQTAIRVLNKEDEKRNIPNYTLHDIRRTFCT